MSETEASYRVRIGAWVRARLSRNPNAIKVDAEGLDLFVVRDVLDPQACQDLMRLIDADLVPSGLLGPTDDKEFRTSQTCNPHPDHPLVRKLEQRIHDVVGIQPHLGEYAQGQRYAVGQQFKPHFDWFDTGSDYWPRQIKGGGQRTWTAMLFLNEPEAGGHTVFTEANVTVRPRAGNLLVWNNLTSDGQVNIRSKHQGSPVEAGVKYVITKWFRERTWKPLDDDIPTY
ncbi:MAG: prolyl hydroxylase family protein [Allosphingosinicella sp.]|uniref:prolyl hydroxylase family protein n=1 Tax=Allosphingosinicella sp. TaxID=2823234 RepID=UPI003929E05B